MCRSGGSQVPRNAPQGWVLLPGLSAVTRGASGICLKVSEKC